MNQEKQFGILLPDDVKKIFLVANNGRPSVSTFDSPKAKGHVLKKLLSFNKEDIETVYKVKAVVENDDTSLFPIANDPFGNLICICDSHVVYWYHETGEVKFLANTFTEFLNHLY